MRNLLILFLIVCSTAYGQTTNFRSDLKEGDLIFQRSMGPQSMLIAAATHSDYTHCGILFFVAGQWQVLEAVEPVKYTPLDEWIKRGKDRHFVIKRLKDRDKSLTPAIITRMKQEGNTMLKKHYDLLFSWTDDKLYCSELIWKLYKHNTNLEVGTTAELKDFDLSNPAIQLEMTKRYGKNIPYHEKVISPDAIFKSPLLLQVTSK